MAFENEQLAFELHMEFGRRKCVKCKTQNRGLYVVNYPHNGYPRPTRHSLCAKCAEGEVVRMAEKIRCAAVSADAYMLGATL